MVANPNRDVTHRHINLKEITGKLEEAYAANREGQYDVAEKIFEDVLMQDSNNIEARKGIALCYLKQRNNKAAIDHLKAYVVLSPRNTKYTILLADALQTEGRLADAVNVCLHCLEFINDKNVHNKLLKCLLALPLNHQIEVLQLLVDSARATADEYLHLAKSYFTDKNTKLAKSVMASGISKYPESSKLLSLAAELALDENNFKEAYVIDSRLVKAKPSNALYRHRLYRSAYELTRYDEAFQLIVSLRQEFPNDYRYILGEGLCLYQLEEYDAAIQKLEDVSQRRKESSWRLQYNIGIVAARMGDIDKAKISLSKAIDLNQTVPEPRLFLSNIFHEERNYSAAKDLLINLFSTAPTQSVEDGLHLAKGEDIPLISFSHVPIRRKQAVTNRIVRDTALVKELKTMYGDTCQICSARIIIGPDKYYSEVHHIRPLGVQHNGPDTIANAIVLCPNHHTTFDYGCIAIHPVTYDVYEYQLGGVLKISRLQLNPAHSLAVECLAYYVENIFLGRLE